MDEDGFGEEIAAINSSGNAGATNGSDDDDATDGLVDTKRTVGAASC